MDARRPQALEAGLFLLVVALPIAFFPLSREAFLDVKVVVLTGGTLLLWASGLPYDRRVGVPALAWACTLVVAAIVGVDPLESLVGTVRATGLVMLLCSLAIVAVAPNVPDDLVERMRGWIVTTGLVVAAVILLARIAPAVLEPLAPRLAFSGATFGNPVHAIGFLAACVPAVLAGPERRARAIATFGLLGVGLAVAEERSAVLLPVVALLASAWFLRPGWRRIAGAAAVIGVALALWSVVPSSLVSGGPSESATALGQFQTLRGERQRLALYEANLRAIADRPVLGWGPANTWTGFLSSGTADEVEQAGRNWADAHNLVLEVTVVSGLVGLAAFGWLAIRVSRRALRPATSRRWLVASAVTLLAYAALQPLDVVLTPLLFLFAGAAAGGRAVGEAPEKAPDPRRQLVPRTAAVIGLSAATTLAGVNLLGSALEEWGRTHAESNWALRAATAVAPWRLTATEALAMSLAIDGRAGDPDAAIEARAVVGGTVDRHPWNPGVRLLAADVELLLRNPAASQDWIRDQLERFPSDQLSDSVDAAGLDLSD
ncbi:MAG TPA: O-antigen ligase family protein [Actinomycetota bacterium]